MLVLTAFVPLSLYAAADEIERANYKSIGTGSSFGTYQTALKDNCPIHLSLSTGTNRHGVMNMGYAESTTGTPYLMVMDCWNDYGRFVKFENYFTSISGLKIWVA